MQKQTSDYNALANKIFVIVAEHCYFPDSVVQTQCKRINKTPATLSTSDLAVLAARIGNSVAMFTNPEKGLLVEESLKHLALGV